MLLIYIPLVILPLFLLGFVSNWIYSNSIINKTTKNAYDESTLIMTRIENVIGQAESFSTIFTTGVNNLFQLHQAENNDVSSLELKNQIRNELSFIHLSFPDVDSAFYIDQNAQMISTDVRHRDDSEVSLQHPIIQKTDEYRSMNVWFPMQMRSDFVSDPSQPVITLGKRIIEIRTGELRGYLIINISERTFSDIFKRLEGDKHHLFHILDSEGRIISSQVEEELLQFYEPSSMREFILANHDFAEVKRFRNQDQVVTSMLYKKFGWRLVQEIPTKQLTSDIQRVGLIILFIGLLCLCLTLWGAELLSRLIVRPIIDLKKSMLKVREGKLGEYFEARTRDEIGQLAIGFNSMIDRIRDLIADVKAEQRKKREYELALIQAQIKPHFLYNTLDLIYVLSDMGRNTEACEATKALADYYRIVLSV